MLSDYAEICCKPLRNVHAQERGVKGVLAAVKNVAL